VNYDRRGKYSERDFHMSFSSRNHNTIFCLDCKATQCCNTTHNRIYLHPILRVPKRTASKVKWARFYKEMNKFGEMKVN
jgi:hypothetical protein